MRASDSLRVLFVHVPKTGGSTVDHMFDTEIHDARKVGELPRHTTYPKLLAFEQQLSGYWSFGFVRNPWARMVSWWSMYAAVYRRYDAGNPRVIRAVHAKPGIWLLGTNFHKDFDRFVLEGTGRVPKLGRPQIDWLGGRGGVDFTGRVESYDHDYNFVRERLGLTPIPEAPRLNTNTHDRYTEYYTPETAKRVGEVFAADVEAFGYQFGD